MADPVYQDQPYMRKSFLFFSDVYLTGAVQLNEAIQNSKHVFYTQNTYHASLLTDASSPAPRCLSCLIRTGKSVKIVFAMSSQLVLS